MAQWSTSHRKLLASDTTQPLSHVHIPLCLSLNELSLFLCHCMIFLAWESCCSLLLWKKSVGERLQYRMYTDFLFTAVEGSNVRNEEDPSSVTSCRANLTSVQVCGEANLLSICCFRVQFLSWCLESVNLCWRLMSCSMSFQPLESELQNSSFLPCFLLMI
jgi:hypothetical protein